MKRHKPSFSEVAISRGAEDLLSLLRANVDLIGGIDRYVKPTDTVFIKPNLTAGMPTETGGTTDVLFAEAVVELVKEANPNKIIVGECSGNESRSIESLVNCGYADMCKRQGVEMVDLDFAEFVDIPLEDALYKDVVHLPKVVVESDVFISVPVLKTHLSCGVTMALKNSFGLVPDYDKLNAHRDQAIEKILVDISCVKPPDLIFVDGRIGAEGIAGGSDFDHPIRADIVYVGNDPVAVDIVGTHLMMQNPRVRYIQWAGEKGIGNDNLDYILIRGLSIEEARVPFMSPADQVMRESNGKVRIYELDACTLCRTFAAGAVARYSKNPNSLLEPVDIVLGPGTWDMPKQINPRTVLLGDCVREEYRSQGTWIGGCPISPEAYGKVLADYDIVCTKCADVVEKVVAKYTPEQLAGIRILASNKMVYKGANNQAQMDDYLLAVGDCQKGYCRNHARRVHKVSDIDVSEYIEMAPGCCPGEADVIAALDNVLTRVEAAGKGAAK